MTMCLILMFTVLTGCSGSEKSNGSSFVATVLENNNSSLLVEPKEGSNELKSADKIVVYMKDADLVGSDDGKITVEDIEPGMQVKISYNGGIAESYPAQLQGCYRIKLLN